jgi:hypothetical protein
LTANPFDVLGIPPEAAAHLDHNELQMLLALRKKIEDSRYSEMQRAIESLRDPCTLEALKKQLAEDNDVQHAPIPPVDRQPDAEGPVTSAPPASGFASGTPSTAEPSSPKPGDGMLFSNDRHVEWLAKDSYSADEELNDDADKASRVESATEVESGTQSSLVSIDTELARYRVVVREVVRDSQISTGVSLGWLAKKASELALSRDELEELLATRRDFGAGMPALMRAIMNGMQAPDLYHLYRVRDEAASVLEGPTFSIKWINEFSETFPEASVDDESLAEVLIYVHNEVQSRIPWLWKYPDDALQTLIQVARSYQVNNIESCLARLGSRRDDG